MLEKYLKIEVLENRSTFVMYLNTSTTTQDFSEMYLSTFQVLYKLYVSTDVLKYKVLLPGSDQHGSNGIDIEVLRQHTVASNSLSTD